MNRLTKHTLIACAAVLSLPALALLPACIDPASAAQQDRPGRWTRSAPDIWRDPERPVTCWIMYGSHGPGISCLPNVAFEAKP